MKSCNAADDRAPRFRCRRALAWIAALGVATVGVCSSALADGLDQSVAEALFEEGRTLLREGKITQACSKLAESQRLSPAGGTALNLAICHEMAGLTATAWNEYHDVVATCRKEGNRARQDIAQQRIDLLEPRLSRLTVNVDAGNPPTLQVKVDAVSLRQPVWGISVPVDPGAHHVTAEAPGRRPWSAVVDVIGDADRKTVGIPLLSADDAPSASTKPAASAAPVLPRPVRPEAGGDAQNGHTATLGYVAGGLGVASLGLGLWFGLRAKSSWDERNNHCPLGHCDEQAVAAYDRTRTAALGADIAIPAGVALSALGVWWVLTDRKAPVASTQIAVTPCLDQAGGGLRIGGRFW